MRPCIRKSLRSLCTWSWKIFPHKPLCRHLLSRRPKLHQRSWVLRKKTRRTRIKKPNGRKDVYGSEDLDDEKYLTTDFLDNEQSTTKSEFNDQDLPTSMGNPCYNTQKVLHVAEASRTPIDNSLCNLEENQGYLSPLQYGTVIEATDLILDENKPQTPPPPLPPDRQSC